MKTAAQRALYNNLGEDEDLALAVDTAIQASRMDGWRSKAMKSKRVRNGVKAVIKDDNALCDQIVELATHQNDY